MYKVSCRYFLCLSLSVTNISAQGNPDYHKQTALIVVAHPDDESMMAATIFGSPRDLPRYNCL